MAGATKLVFLTALNLLLGLRFILAACSDSDSCEGELNYADAGLSLLQTSSKRTWPPQSPSNHESDLPREKVPAHLYELGLKILKSAETLDRVIDKSRVQTEQLVGQKVTFRMAKGDGVDGVEGYGLKSLREVAANRSGMVNMLDIGGNLGRVSIAAFKQASKKMRIIVVEPVPVTYFLLRWNLWLNGIPALTPEEFKSSPKKAGVLALNNAITDVDGHTVRLCDGPMPQSMKARTCECSAADQESGQKICVVGNSMDYFLNFFGNQDIDLLKIDCEGCEFHAIQALTKHLETTGQRIGKFTGELHEQGNRIEDLVCKFDGGRSFWHVCFMKGGFWKTVDVGDRCKIGSARESCLRSMHGVE